MLINKPSDVKSSEITPEKVYRNRRAFMKETAALALVVGCSVALHLYWPKMAMH